MIDTYKSFTENFVRKEYFPIFQYNGKTLYEFGSVCANLHTYTHTYMYICMLFVTENIWKHWIFAF